eukprot:5632688-Pleurochrysis_carterae.AAC.1
MAPVTPPPPSPPPVHPVLLVIADDLRPSLNVAYSQKHMYTPALDAFAREALTFDRAYTNFAICSASRNSFLSGRVPDKTRTWNFIDHFRHSGLSSNGGPSGRDWVSLPQFFKEHGYTVLGHGKMYHPFKPPFNDEPLSWSKDQPYVQPSETYCPPDGHGALQCFCPGVSRDGSSDEGQFSDFNMTMQAISSLGRFSDRPFFIAVGLHFPHLPWATPAWAAEKYDAANLSIAKFQAHFCCSKRGPERK